MPLSDARQSPREVCCLIPATAFAKEATPALQLCRATFDTSLLYQAISGSDGVEQMPPKGKLAAAVVADFRQWIKMGAPDPREGPENSAAIAGIRTAKTPSQVRDNDWWSLRPLQKPAVPELDSESAAWAHADRRVHHGQAERAWPESFARGRPADLDSPAFLRPDRPATSTR